MPGKWCKKSKEIMKWEIFNLVEVCDFQGGTQPPKSEWLNEKRDGYVRMIQIRDFTQGKDSFVEYVKDSKKLKKCSAADIMIGRYGASIGKILTGLEGAYNVALVKTIPSNKLDRSYFYHYLNASYFQNFIQNAGSRAAQAGFNKEELKELQIALPPLPTQQKIATILDEADTLCHKDKTLLAKYDELLQSVFYDMFGDLFLPGTKNRTEYLSAVGDLVSGVAKNTNTIKDDFVEVAYMRVANVQDGHINLNEIKSILVSQQDFNKYLLRENDLLLTEGGDPDKLGRGAVWKGQISPCIHQNHIFRIRITLPDLHPTYLSYLLSSKYGKAYFLKMAKQTTGIASINMTQLKNFRVIFPDFSLQKKFADIIENIEQQKSQIIQQQTYSENLFQSLMQRAFKGELVQ